MIETEPDMTKMVAMRYMEEEEEERKTPTENPYQ